MFLNIDGITNKLLLTTTVTEYNNYSKTQLGLSDVNIQILLYSNYKLIVKIQ